MIAIIDYGMGNLKNVQKAFEKLGYEAIITEEKEVIYAADKIVLPGVGAFGEAMNRLKTLALDEVIKQAVSEKKPLLGICLGMQLLFETSEENGKSEGLGLIPGKVKKLDVPYKVPHMGWNDLVITQEVPLFTTQQENPFVYFVHSYYVETEACYVSAYTDYGKKIAVAIQKEMLFGMQYHPEKSSDSGMKMLEAFCKL